MYFNNFNRVLYDFDINGTTKSIAVMDITKNVRIIKETLANITLYDEYDVQDGETPEIIAEKFYGNAKYHWIVMLVNERYDGILDFPQPDRVVDKIITEKYGEGNQYEIHHYERDINNDGVYYIVSENDLAATPITNHDYEYSLNESKRRIKIIDPRLVRQVLAEYNNL